MDHGEFKKIADSQPEYLRPTLRLFLSVDLVNSTAFKQKTVEAKNENQGRERYSPWLDEITKFYREYPATFNEKWKLAEAICKHANANKKYNSPRLWKANGDELIYVVELQSLSHVRIVLSAWLSALSAYRVQLLKGSHGLNVKSASWVAGFPIRNSEILFRHDMSAAVTDGTNSFVQQIKLNKDFYEKKRSAGILRDYVGPAIDTGFRLGAFATPRKFILSIELACLISESKFPQVAKDGKSTFDVDKFSQELVFYFENRSTLKGVLGGRPYPIFWIDADKFASHSLPENESKEVDLNANQFDDRMSFRQPTPPSTVANYCKEFIASTNGLLSIPFMLNDVDYGAPSSSDYYDDYCYEIEKWKKVAKNEEASEQIVAPANADKSTVKLDPKILDDIIKSLTRNER